jgi:hypothetical protein
MPKCWFDAEKCARGIDALELYRAEYDDKLQALRPRPLHDWTSHAADAFHPPRPQGDALWLLSPHRLSTARRGVIAERKPPPLCPQKWALFLRTICGTLVGLLRLRGGPLN